VRLVQNLSSIIISILLALLVWVAAVREQNPLREADYSQLIPIQVIPPSGQLVLTSSLPASVQLRLLAPESSWSTLTPAKIKAAIDLSQLDAGPSEVPVTVEIADGQVKVINQTPDSVSVNLEALRTITLPVQIDVMDGPPLGYVNRIPLAEPPNVTITGPVSVLEQVDEAATEIFIRNSKETIQAVRNVVVRNQEDQIVRDVKIEPAKVEVTLPIEQRFGYKDVSVRVQVQGQVASGYRVSNISVRPPTLTLVGSPRGLGAVAGFVETVPINLNQATENIIQTVPLDLPDGVTTVSSEGSNGPGGVEVLIEVTPIENSITLQRPVNQQGIDPDYWWRASPDRVDVFLSGPLPRLQTLLAGDVKVIVDLFGLEPGTYKLQPTVFQPDGVRLDATLPDTIEVTIGRTIERPVTQVDLRSDYSWTATPNRVNVLIAGPASRLHGITPNDIEVILNLADLEPGVYRIKPVVTLPDTVKLDSILPGAVDVTIQARNALTTTPALTTTDIITATLAPEKDDEDRE
jgi:YbbR domain-containing protein